MRSAADGHRHDRGERDVGPPLRRERSGDIAARDRAAGGGERDGGERAQRRPQPVRPPAHRADEHGERGEHQDGHCARLYPVRAREVVTVRPDQ